MGLKRRTWILVIALAVSPVIFIWYPLSFSGAQEPTTALQVTEPVVPAEKSQGAEKADKASAAKTPRAQASGGDWMTTVDQIFGKYLVQPLASVLFFDFWTHDLQMHFLREQDLNGDGKISRDEARGRLATAFDELDKNRDGYLEEDEYKTLAPSVPFVVLWLLMGGIYFTLRMSFINVRGFWHAIRLTKGDYDDPNETGEVSHFQALASALSATVGLGNIAGVAIAVGSGGPGAIVWLIFAGLFGMSSKFAECTLGQMYRKVSADGTVSGGPMHYLRDGLRDLGWGRVGAVLATVYAVICMGASFGGGCAFQVGQSMGPIKDQIPFLNDFPWVYGLVMAVMVGVVIIGGIRRIAATAGKVVPLMCSIYVAMSMFVLIYNYQHIVPAFRQIFREAFTANAMFGGFLGVAVIGIKRAVFSNEAGIGSASIAHAAARTDEPVSEGIVALLEPFIDTVVVCTMTGLVIVITGVYEQPEYADLVIREDGAALTSRRSGNRLQLVSVRVVPGRDALRLQHHDLLVVLRRAVLVTALRLAHEHRLQVAVPVLRCAGVDHYCDERKGLFRPDDPVAGIPEYLGSSHTEWEGTPRTGSILAPLQVRRVGSHRETVGSSGLQSGAWGP